MLTATRLYGLGEEVVERVAVLPKPKMGPIPHLDGFGRSWFGRVSQKDIPMMTMTTVVRPSPEPPPPSFAPTDTTSPPPDEPQDLPVTPIYKKGWFWAIAGIGVGVGITGIVLARRRR